jgi:hypothetical protein
MYVWTIYIYIFVLDFSRVQSRFMGHSINIYIQWEIASRNNDIQHIFFAHENAALNRQSWRHADCAGRRSLSYDWVEKRFFCPINWNTWSLHCLQASISIVVQTFAQVEISYNRRQYPPWIVLLFFSLLIIILILLNYYYDNYSWWTAHRFPFLS